MLYEKNNVRNWASLLDEKTLLQAEMLGRSPVLCGPVALMPDAHLGKGATVGSVLLTKNGILPAAVGVDIGCGVEIVKTNLLKSDLDGVDLTPLIKMFSKSIPAGVGKAHEKITQKATKWYLDNPPPHQLSDKLTSIALSQLGTLGSGNHFCEICLDENDVVWAMLHSGSRGVGNQLAVSHIKVAQDQCAANNIELEDRELAFLTNGTPEFNSYIEDMQWSQKYAFYNREFMMQALLEDFFGYVDKETGLHGELLASINCHHNFSQQEYWSEYGGLIWVTRKGAIGAMSAERGIIPGSMGTKSYIAEGLGNPLSYYSSSHGAGRIMSRGQAKRELTVDSLTKAMEGRVWDSYNARALLDEHPSAYKDIDMVMDDQKDLTKPIHTLRQIVNYKGT